MDSHHAEIGPRHLCRRYQELSETRNPQPVSDHPRDREGKSAQPHSGRGNFGSRDDAR